MREGVKFDVRPLTPALSPRVKRVNEESSILGEREKDRPARRCYSVAFSIHTSMHLLSGMPVPCVSPPISWHDCMP